MILRFTFLERILHRLHFLPAPIVDTFANVLFGRALAIAVRRGLFDALARGPMDADQISALTRLHPHALRLLLDACIVAGYLGRREGVYRLSVDGRKWLCSDSPDSLVNLIAYFETLHVRWGDLEASLDHGAPGRPYYEAFNENDWRTYVLGMRDLARFLLPHVIGKITPGPEARTLLDIGGSHGLFAIECCRRRTDLRATIMDFAPALELASSFARESGVAERLELKAGDFRTALLPPGQDVALLFNIIHGLSDVENRLLMNRVLEAVRPGGKLFILDQIRDNRSPVSHLARFIPLMVGLNLLNEIGGTAYALDDIRRWCGGRRVTKANLRLPGVSLVEVRA
jgi:hypothetical protein